MKRFSITTYCLILLLSTFTLPVRAQNKTDVDRINKWFDDQKEKQKSRDEYWKNIHVGPIQKPGEIQKAGTLQKPGTIEIPKGWKAIKSESLPCQRRFTVSGDTLFEFDKSTLTPHAVTTLDLLVPELKKNTNHPVTVEGHTDSIGTDTYNERLSFKRAETVKNWLSDSKVFDKDNIKIKGFGKDRPIAPNTNPDGSDNPAGRQLNRRVEIIINTCVTVEPKPATVSEGEKPPEPKTNAEAADDSSAGGTSKTWSIDEGTGSAKGADGDAKQSADEPSKPDAGASSTSDTDQSKSGDAKGFPMNNPPLNPLSDESVKTDAVPSP